MVGYQVATFDRARCFVCQRGEVKTGRMKNLLRISGLLLVRSFGTKLYDYADGSYLGKAFILTAGGRIHMIGYEGQPFRLVYIPQDRLNYWKVSIGFSKAEVPDFSSEDK